MKNKKENTRVGSGQKNYYVLSEKEHGDFADAFFQVESTLNIIGNNCSAHGNSGNQELLDISNCLELIKSKLKVMSSLLLK